MAGASTGHSLTVPIFGDIGKLASGQKLMLGVIVTVALIVVIVLVAFIGGEIF